MIDFSNEIFNAVAVHLRSVYPGIQVLGEYVDTPAKFPTVTIDEILNVPDHLDSAAQNRYARVSYRIQVFCNGEGKRRKAREIYSTTDALMQGFNLIAKTYTTTPAIYNSEIYSITATHEGVIGEDGVIYRN